MDRSAYQIFTAGKIANLTLPNRLVRSATWEPSVICSRQVTDQVLDLYRALALGGVGLIITGGFPVLERAMSTNPGSAGKLRSYDDIRIDGIGKIAQVVHDSGTGCSVVAQLEVGYLGAEPSEIDSPFRQGKSRSLSTEEIREVVDGFVQAIVGMKAAGFDGVQLHAAHGGLLSRFLSPYTNRRSDAYGGSAWNRVRIVWEIISQARGSVGDWPILIKMNCTDYLEGGIDVDTFPELAAEVVRAGVDAIEISGGMWDCLARPEEELGFRRVPAPESHTCINSPDKQSYFLECARRLDVDVPVILVGGNRDIERLEAMVRQGTVDFVALCRPLISEPDLPNRWREGRGSSATDCISCNSCIHAMIVHPGREVPELATCVFKRDQQQHKMAQAWLASWTGKNVVA